MKLRGVKIFLLLPFVLAICSTEAQKYLLSADSCNTSRYPVIRGTLYHRGYGETILKKEDLEIREDGKPVEFSLSPLDMVKRLPKNKRVFFLIESHYEPKKGIPERDFFANVISAGVDGTISPGDKCMIASFDWQRQGKYIFPAFEQYTDDTAVLRNALRKLAPKEYLGNRQEGADINNSLDEALKYLSPVSDSLPTAIILFSDDLDNSVGKIVNLDIKNKALQARIPIYAVSYEMYSRYNPVMRDEICKATYGQYFISPKNDVVAAGEKLSQFLAGIIKDYQGTRFSFAYSSHQPNTEQKINLQFIIRNTSISDAQIVTTPALTIKEKIIRNKLKLILGGVGLLLVSFFLFFYFRKTKTTEKAQESLLHQTREDLQHQSELLVKEKTESETRLKEMQQQQLDREFKKISDEKKQKEETRLIQLMKSRGNFPSLHYSYKDTNGKIDVNAPVFTIGRDQTNSFYITLGTVSRNHASILFDESGNYTLVDNNSSNGTKVNGQRVDTVVLQSGDHIEIGGLNMIFHN